MKVLAVMSIPRLTFSDNVSCVLKLQELGIPFIHSTGAYWDRGMQKCFEYAIAQGFTHVLTVDYDSVFTTADVRTLINTAIKQDIDIVAGNMAGRENLGPLYTTDIVEDGEIIPVNTAHFGLTLINTDVLADVGGDWVGGSIEVEPDILLWQSIKKDGYQAYVHKGVNVGHLSLVIKHPDGSYEGLEDYHVRIQQAR